MSSYYRFPLNFSNLIQKKELATCGLEKSIAQNIYLILTSQFGEFRYDETYGCSIWEHDFENIVSVHSWKDRIAQSIRLSLIRHEMRLLNPTVRIEIGQEEKVMPGKEHISRIKKCIDITVSGTIAETNEPFTPYTQRLYISPFSFD
ncbi:MAG: GPW/gp25 family protein [Flavobacteriales bacterium]|nr:GPW/gp25 family protein [Flavobacteriales bacterium]